MTKILKQQQYEELTFLGNHSLLLCTRDVSIKSKSEAVVEMNFSFGFNQNHLEHYIDGVSVVKKSVNVKWKWNISMSRLLRYYVHPRKDQFSFKK